MRGHIYLRKPFATCVGGNLSVNRTVTRQGVPPDARNLVAARRWRVFLFRVAVGVLGPLTGLAVVVVSTQGAGGERGAFAGLAAITFFLLLALFLCRFELRVVEGSFFLPEVQIHRFVRGDIGERTIADISGIGVLPSKMGVSVVVETVQRDRFSFTLPQSARSEVAFLEYIRKNATNLSHIDGRDNWDLVPEWKDIEPGPGHVAGPTAKRA